MAGREVQPAPITPRAVRVLVVDDSAFMRYVICHELAADATIEVVGTARDGIDALQKVAALKPDVVTLDIEMPRMDGLAALERIMAEDPLPVILLSTHSGEGTAVTIRGLELGAVDFVQKPAVVQTTSASATSTWERLVAQVKSAGRLDPRRLRARAPVPRVAARASVRPSTWQRPGKAERVVVIGTSTGGPRALFEVVPHLPATLPAGVLIVQHMPPGFTRSLARRLDEVSALKVREAENGDIVEPGVVLLAPGDFHMAVRKGGRVTLEKTPALHGVRPAVDVTMESAASVYGSSAIGTVLTGMGTDGTRGALAIKRAGGFVVTQEESTCVVYGMPRSAVEAGASSRVVRLEEVADAIIEAVMGTLKAAVGGSR